MQSLNTPKLAAVKAAVVGLLAYGLLAPVAGFAATQPGTGTLVGTVTCGPAEDAPAAHIAVIAEGTTLHTLTDGLGRFMLTGLPAGQSITIDAVADAQASMVTSRYNVVVQPGETLDIGSMDLSICGQPAQPAPAPDNQMPADYQDRG
jgi:hypothetical protein